MSVFSVDLKALYRKLCVIRECEERIRKDYFSDEMKTPVHLGIGGEAISVGVNECLPPETKIFATYRNHAIYLARTGDTDSFFGELYGKISGCGKGKAGSMHMADPEKGLVATSAVVATTIPLAVGAALANQLRKDSTPTAVFFGDGALEEGVFWESLNFASLRKLPVVFVCEDNDLAIHTFTKHRQGFKSFKDVAAAFHCHYRHADGSDILEVIESAKKALVAQEREQIPIILHYSYYRFLEHVGPLEDYVNKYRSKPKDLAKYDPLLKIVNVMLQNGVSKEEIESLRSEVLETIEKSVLKAKSAPFPTEEELFTDVWMGQSPTPWVNFGQGKSATPSSSMTRKRSENIPSHEGLKQ